MFMIDFWISILRNLQSFVIPRSIKVVPQTTPIYFIHMEAESIFVNIFVRHFFEVFEHIWSYYSDYDEAMLEDMIELVESILQCVVLVMGMEMDDVFRCLRDLIATMKTDHEQRRLRGRGRPEVCVQEDQ